MDAFRCLFVLGLLHFTTCIDKRILYDEPPCMKAFDVNRYMGRWYIVSTVNPCSWNGANEFTDWYHDYELDGNQGHINGNGTWRYTVLPQASENGDSCVKVPVKLTMTGPSSYRIQDSIGDVSTSDAVIVATDYTCFVIAWGCTKRSVDGRTCPDPWIDLKTREPVVTPTVRRIADAIFQKLWGLTTDDLLTINQSKACDVGS